MYDVLKSASTMRLMRYLLRPKQLFKVFVGCIVFCLLIIVYTYISMDHALETLSILLHRTLTEEKLRRLMEFKTSSEVCFPLEDIILPHERMLSFYHLPHRLLDVSYSEITTANRDTSYPLAPDFTFHLEYSEHEVVLFEDYGPGCILRIFIMPVLPTESNLLHKVDLADLRSHYLLLRIDGVTYWFSLQQMAEGEQWPFLAPINTQHPKPASGMGSYTPFCYQRDIKITYQPEDQLPGELFEQTVNCSLNDLPCMIHIYTGISQHRYPVGATVPSFSSKSVASEEQHRKVVENSVTLLSRPHAYGPDSGQRCIMSCVFLCANCRLMLYKSDTPSVISSIKVRVFELSTLQIIPDWSQILLTMVWDDSLNPQVDRVPLSALFGMAGSLNDHRGASMGHHRKSCSYVDDDDGLPQVAMTGYIYFPMPFWRSAHIYIEGVELLEGNLKMCFQITTVTNHYAEESTGYFSIDTTFYSNRAEGWRDILTLEEYWGHIVAVSMEIDNLRAYSKGSAVKWTPLQADVVFFLDGSQSASMLGTGLEDYFSYSHGFRFAENTSYAFVGVPHTSMTRAEPLSWHCYRLHVLDPIPFHHGIKFMMEGTQKNHFDPEQALTHEEHSNRKSAGLPVLSFTIMYYAKPTSAPSVLDLLQLADPDSESAHHFRIISKSQPDSGEIFKLSARRYIGNRIDLAAVDKQGRRFLPDDRFQFQIDIADYNNGALLRREFYSSRNMWNEKLHLWVNGKDLGGWFFPMGTLSEEYSLQQADFLLHRNLTNMGSGSRLTIEILAITDLCDISYNVITI